MYLGIPLFIFSCIICFTVDNRRKDPHLLVQPLSRHIVWAPFIVHMVKYYNVRACGYACMYRAGIYFTYWPGPLELSKEEADIKQKQPSFTTKRPLSALSTFTSGITANYVLQCCKYLDRLAVFSQRSSNWFHPGSLGFVVCRFSAPCKPFTIRPAV